MQPAAATAHLNYNLLSVFQIYIAFYTPRKTGISVFRGAFYFYPPCSGSSVPGKESRCNPPEIRRNESRPALLQQISYIVDQLFRLFPAKARICN